MSSDFMGAIRVKFRIWIAVPKLSCLLWSGLVKRYWAIQQANRDITMFPYELVSTHLHSLQKPWIGRQWLWQTLPVRHGTRICYGEMERGETCHADWRSVRFAIVYDNHQALRWPPKSYNCCSGAMTSTKVYNDSLSSTTVVLGLFLLFLTTNYVCRHLLIYN